MILSDIHSIDDFKAIPINKLPELASEIRTRIIEVVRANGGHLASNLGAVELTIAVHYVFHSPKDKIIFDVGHQSYTHKILTGRNQELNSLRLEGGVSGFLRRSESVHDPVNSGHASSSISQAAGYAESFKLLGDDHRVVAVIGDGAFTGGVAFEGLNFCGHNELPLIVIFNDNEMSIDHNVSAVSKYINHVAVSDFYRKMVCEVENTLKLNCFPLKGLFYDLLNKINKGVKAIIDYDNVFSNFGFDYIGPINGHHVEELIYILQNAKKNIKKPLLLHVKTKKGKGFLAAEMDPVIFHGVPPHFSTSVKKQRSFTDVFSDKMLDLGKKHSDIVAITAAMESGTGLSQFHEAFPERFFDVGIAEQHAVTFASTLAYGGFHPVVAIYSTFFMRAVDQLCQDIAITAVPVILAVDRAGIVGADGETHNGQFDISFLRMLPNIIVLAPCDALELELMMEWAYRQKNTVAIRYPRDTADILQMGERRPEIEKHFFITVKEGKDILFVVIGTFVKMVLESIEESAVDGGVVYLRMIKPLPIDSLLCEIRKYQRVVVIEENVYNGSAAQEIASEMLKNKVFIPFHSINIPDRFIQHGERRKILETLGFSKSSFLKLIFDFH